MCKKKTAELIFLEVYLFAWPPGSSWLVHLSRPSKPLWAGLKQSTRVPCAVDCAPQQTRTGADSSTAAAAASTLLTGGRLFWLPEVCCCCAVKSRQLSLYLTRWYISENIQSIVFLFFLFWGTFPFFKKNRVCGVVKSVVLTPPFSRDAQKTHSQVHLDSLTKPSGQGAVERDGEEKLAHGRQRARKRGGQDASQEAFDFHPLHYLWDSS